MTEYIKIPRTSDPKEEDLFYRAVAEKINSLFTESVATHTSYLSEYASITAAVSSIGASNAKLFIDTTGNITDDLTIPENISLIWEAPGCQITVATTKTLTISGSIRAGLFSIFTLSGTGAVSCGARVGEIPVSWFGAKGDGSTTDNLPAIKAAIAAAPTGGKVIIPPSLSYYKVTSTALTTAAVISKRLTIQIDGDLKATNGEEQADPPFMFKVTGNDVVITGSGSIAGNGTKDDSNISGVFTNVPGLIYVTGNRVSITNLLFDTPPKTGVHLESCNNALIKGCRFTGGVTAYSDTSYFYITANSGEGHQILDNRFYPDSGGGMGVNCIFSVSTDKMIVSGNECYSPWEKLSYCYGDRNIFSNNYVENGHITSAFRCHGSYNKIIGNTVDGYGDNNDGSGAIVYDGVYNEICDNNFINCTQVGIAVGQLDEDYESGFSGTKIVGNTITGASSGTQSNGIQLALYEYTSQSIIVANNIIVGMADGSSDAGIWVSENSDDAIYDLNIIGNTINTAYNGILINRVSNCIIAGNIISNMNAAGYGIKATTCSEIQVSGNFFRSPGSYAFYESSSSQIRYYHNQVRSASNSGISGAGSNSHEIGNQYDGTELKSSHIADVGYYYTAGELDTEAEVISAVNAHGTAINAILAALEKYGILKTS